jgi:hypothetical protein
MDWAPAECTLPTAERPLRVAEFDSLFAGSLRTLVRLDPTRLRLSLDGAPEVEETTRDLVARETACCSFFTFTVTPEPDAGLRLDIEVPAQRADVLDALAARAVAAAPGAAA